MDEIKELIRLAKDKVNIDSSNSWSTGSKTYLEEIRKELIEVETEIKANKKVYLEDELGDVLWDYINLLANLEKEGKIKLGNVFKRSKKKYLERINGIKSNISWDEIKKKQKKELKEEQDKF